MYIFLSWFSPTNVWNSQTLRYTLPSSSKQNNSQCSSPSTKQWQTSTELQTIIALTEHSTAATQEQLLRKHLSVCYHNHPDGHRNTCSSTCICLKPSSTSWLRNWPHNIALFLKVRDKIIYFVMIYLSEVFPLNSTIAAVGNGHIQSYKTKATVNVNMAVTCTGKLSRVATSFMTC